ncbi:hypothetical protein D8M04_00665 [Oceanobacillus piezotolerans]|uniref:DNA-binding protein n=1 Tax=Oceanobacillus piezotolerans TaxID=2448030 RepID=A0A498DCQ4_9BACI|nr:hypothetical protein [Oceanobacillus piezotolerans]RLL47826.1 hypothetical protein D8M04_00665 [Oceanobacillus piezotolerans]
MFKRNDDIREAKGNIPFWILAEHLNIHENTLLNWMKKEMPEEKKKSIFNAIEAAKKEWN